MTVANARHAPADGSSDRSARGGLALEVAPLRFLRRIRIVHNGACSLGFDLDLHELARPFDELGVCVSTGGIPLVEAVECEAAFPESLPDKVRGQIASLENGGYELWPADHNVNDGAHFPDPFGDATELLASLERALPVVRPIVNHNKVSSRKSARRSCDRLHVDAFRGMQLDEAGKRLRVWRTFLNLGDAPRDTVVCLHDPELVDRLLPRLFEDRYLDPLIAACEHRLRAAILSTPPRDRAAKRVFGFKILTTHLLHCEYGPSGDLLAVVNSLR